MASKLMAPTARCLRRGAKQRSSIYRTCFQCQYHSYDRPLPAPYPEHETAILSAAIRHVPTHGFTQQALDLGIKDAGFLDISTNLFPHKTFDLIKFYLVTQRLALKTRVQFPENTNLGVGSKVRSLVLERLRANAEHDIVHQWQSALASMSLAENLGSSLKELNSLSDEIWYLAGDTSVDTSWYTKRASLAGVYAATEVYQTTDESTDFRDTEKFLDRRLEEVRFFGGIMGGTVQWAAFQGGAFVNLLRSKGVRI